MTFPEEKPPPLRVITSTEHIFSPFPDSRAARPDVTTPSPRRSRTPRRIPPERLAFLQSHETTTRRKPSPGSLPEEAKQPYLGPHRVDTQIPKKAPRNWAIKTQEGRLTQSLPSSPAFCRSSSAASNPRSPADEEQRTSAQSPGRTGEALKSLSSSPSVRSSSSETLTPGETGDVEQITSAQSPRHTDGEPISRHSDMNAGELPFEQLHIGVTTGSDSPHKRNATTSPLQNSPNAPQPLSASDGNLLWASVQDAYWTHIPSPKPDLGPMNMAPFDYAIGPFLDDASDDVRSGVYAIPSPKEPMSFAPYANSTGDAPLDDTAQCLSNRTQAEPCYPTRPPAHHLEPYGQTITDEMRSKRLLMRQVVILCAMRNWSVMYQQLEAAIAPLIHYNRTCQLIREKALPIAKELDLQSYQAICYYLIGRGEAALKNCVAVERAFEEALEHGIASGLQDAKLLNLGDDTVFWLEKVKQEREAGSALNLAATMKETAAHNDHAIPEDTVASNMVPVALNSHHCREEVISLKSDPFSPLSTSPLENLRWPHCMNSQLRRRANRIVAKRQ
ncbi:hypothetical protein M011DRAFT_330718 [Sporormia fimetaria CBS 119925]|uniref:Uncharacterized protein n=1 Tax=Sporormia fimetaria CBS 119925 TaxID=1340428 RepID=A0A6A6UU82_9PLEO|nr:hypothetical protein M011DRAFT_330718 [Sporormia fimetaria CBS 119925]